MIDDESVCELQNDGDNVFVLVDGMKNSEGRRASHFASLDMDRA
jgi:hypothetical protein